MCDGAKRAVMPYYQEYNDELEQENAEIEADIILKKK